MSNELPDYEVLAKYEPPVMTRIHANDGSLIAEFARERRIYVPFNAMPEQLIQAFISAEDKNFYQHGGLDIQGIMRAARHQLEQHPIGPPHGRRVDHHPAGREELPPVKRPVTIERKLKEAILAIRIERAFTKEQILELYLNEIYLGGGAYGVAAAAQTYWDKALNELSIADCRLSRHAAEGAEQLQSLQVSRASRRPPQLGHRPHGRERLRHARTKARPPKAAPLGVQARTDGPKIFASEYFAEEVRREILDVYRRGQALWRRPVGSHHARSETAAHRAQDLGRWPRRL